MFFERASVTGWILLILVRSVQSASVAEGQVDLPKNRSAPVVAKRYEIVTNSGILSTNPPLAIVYLDEKSGNTSSTVVKRVAQKNLAFVPSLLAVQVGTRVEFPNLDDTYHNIFSYSPAKRFDLGRYRRDEKPVPSQIFDKPGLVTLRCDIHDHMRGLILVLETSHFIVTDDQGHFRLTGLPSGHHVIKAWVDSKTTYEKSVELREGAIARVNFP